MIAARIGESQALILRHLKRHGSSTIPEIAQELNLNVETIRAHLKSLGTEGLVERHGQRRAHLPRSASHPPPIVRAARTACPSPRRGRAPR